MLSTHSTKRVSGEGRYNARFADKCVATFFCELVENVGPIAVLTEGSGGEDNVSCGRRSSVTRDAHNRAAMADFRTQVGL